jgi:hypothetical protein
LFRSLAAPQHPHWPAQRKWCRGLRTPLVPLKSLRENRMWGGPCGLCNVRDTYSLSCRCDPGKASEGEC